MIVDRYPSLSEQATVREEIEAPGGTTANSAAALARLGARVRLAAAIGDDATGRALRQALQAEGVDTIWLVERTGQPTNHATVLVSGEPPERAIVWRPGANLARGDRLDIGAIFASDLVLLDLDDPPLLRFLTDLPAHTAPRARLLGTLNYLTNPSIPDRFELVLRHDAIVGAETDLLRCIGTDDAAVALARLQTAMTGANLRAAAITRGARGSIVLTATECWEIPAFPTAAVDPTGAGDAYAAGIAWGMALRWPWSRVGRFAAALGALATRRLGAQSTLPVLDEVESFLAAHPDSAE